MAELLLRWLNHELELSTHVTDVESDFASGYLLGEILHRLNHQHNFADFMRSSSVDAKVLNFCLLEPTLRNLNVEFDANVAVAIMNEKKDAAANLLYQIKMASARVGRAPGVSTKSLERTGCPLKQQTVFSVSRFQCYHEGNGDFVLFIAGKREETLHSRDPAVFLTTETWNEYKMTFVNGCDLEIKSPWPASGEPSQTELLDSHELEQYLSSFQPFHTTLDQQTLWQQSMMDFYFLERWKSCTTALFLVKKLRRCGGFLAPCPRSGFHIDCPVGTVMDRCLGRVEDGATGDQHHLMFDPPPDDSTVRHRLQHVNPSAYSSELLSLHCWASDGFMHDHKAWYAKFQTLHEPSDAGMTVDEVHEAVASVVNRLLSKKQDEAELKQLQQEAGELVIISIVEIWQSHQSRLEQVCRVYRDPANETPVESVPTSVVAGKAAPKGKAKAPAPAVVAPTNVAATSEDALAESLTVTELLAEYTHVLQRCGSWMEAIAPIANDATQKVAEFGEDANQQVDRDFCKVNLLNGIKYEHDLMERRVRFLQEATEKSCDEITRSMRSIEITLRDFSEDRRIREQVAVAAVIEYIRVAIEGEVALPSFIDVSADMLMNREMERVAAMEQRYKENKEQREFEDKRKRNAEEFEAKMHKRAEKRRRRKERAKARALDEEDEEKTVDKKEKVPETPGGVPEIPNDGSFLEKMLALQKEAEKKEEK
ncbi:P-loop containing nucleoside triphosphate hydrolase [Phytophthora cactorum]|nr:P-loop containing nucleoside triphosphate hydrolase [Phytophthora cactorum]